MTAFNKAFHAEVVRVATKVSKEHLASLKKTVAAQKAEIARLKHSLRDQSSALSNLHRQMQLLVGQLQKFDPTVGKPPPFGPQALAQKRKSLGLTQAQLAQLLGTSTLSVMRWENAKVVPRQAQLKKIAAVLEMTPEEASKRLLKSNKWK